MARIIAIFLLLSVFACSVFGEEPVNIPDHALKASANTEIHVTNPYILKTQVDTPEIEWEKTFGLNSNVNIYSVCQALAYYDPTYNVLEYAVTGYVYSSEGSGENVYLSKYDIDGNKQWESILGGSGNDRGYWVQQTYDNGFLTVGSTKSYGKGGNDIYLIRLDYRGNKTHERTIGGSGNDVGYCIQNVTDREFIISGFTDSYGKGGSDVYLVKVNDIGLKIWDKTFGGKEDDFGYYVQTTDDGYIIVGYTFSFGAGKADVYLVKTDSDGKMLWEKTFGGSENDYGFCVEQTSDGGYIITGSTDSYGAGKDDVYLIKTDSQGQKQWEKTFGGYNNDAGRSVWQSFHGGYMISGNTESYGAGSSDIYMIRTDSEGNMLWENTIGRDGNDLCNSALQTSDAGCVIVGSKESNGKTNTESCLIKLRSDTTPLKVMYVDDGANGTNDGSSWLNAYTYLQDALADVNSSEVMCEIRVAGGKYKPDHGENVIKGDRKANFKLDNPVIIKGGYAGTAAIGINKDPNIRNIDLYDTHVSGDLNDDDVEVTDAKNLLKYNIRPDNSYNIFSMLNNECVVVLDGLHITGCCGSIGGAVDIRSKESKYCYIKINSCTFEENCSARGGAIYNEKHKNIVIDNCKFIHNASSEGGAVDARGDINFSNCIFRENYSSNFGGAIFSFSNSCLIGCVFENNSSSCGGGIYFEGNISISDCIFIGNSANKGGALGNLNRWDYGLQVIKNCIFKENVATTYGGGIWCEYNEKLLINNSLFIGNSSDFWGGALHLCHANGEISNCTIVDNSAIKGGVLSCGFQDPNIQSNIKVINSILRGNSDQVYNYDSSLISISYSCVNDNNSLENISLFANIDDDPLFADPNNDDYHLKSEVGRWDPINKTWVQDDVTSPCIDAGDPNSDWSEELWPHGKRINMGAYGGTSQASMSLSDVGDARDLNNDDVITWDDILLLVDKWDSNDVPLKEDLNLDGVVDINDLTFYENWSTDSNNSVPVLGSIEDRNITINNPLSFSVSASDNDNDELVYKALGLPESAEFSEQMFTWTPEQAGTYLVTFIVSDYKSLDYMTVKIIVEQE